MFKSENNQITIEQVRKLDEEYTLVDIRDEISFEYGHIDGAKNIPLASKRTIHFCQKTSLLSSVAKAVR
jgi:rhodanese-related sulfurtransferase